MLSMQKNKFTILLLFMYTHASLDVLPIYEQSLQNELFIKCLT